MILFTFALFKHSAFGLVISLLEALPSVGKLSFYTKPTTMNYFTGFKLHNARWLLLVVLLQICSWQQAFAQEGTTISGVVISQTDQEAVIGASVVVQGTTRGTVTDVEGNFSLQLEEGDQTLEVSYVGYKPAIITIGNQTTFKVELEENVQQLDELVVVGYGVQKKKDLTGSIATIDSENLKSVPSANPTDALQGKVSGVQVVQQGQPGTAPVIRIRGVGTTGNANPLYVVDGMLLDDISYLSAQDIKSMQVLKDASATAIYGSRGANGVIIITTKEGKKGSNTVNYSGYAGIQNVQRRIDMVNGSQYATLANELTTNNGGTDLPFPDVNNVADTDWFDEIFQVAPIQNHQLTFSGGNDNTLYNVSLSYFKQDGVVKNSSYDRIALRINNTYQMADWFKVGHNIQFSYITEDLAPGNVVQNAYMMAPTDVPTNPDGSFKASSTNVANPAAQLFYESNNRTRRLWTVGTVFAEATIAKDFRLKTNVGWEINGSTNRNFVPQYFVSPTQQNLASRLTVSNNIFTSYLWENTLSYYKEFNEKHQLSAVVGVTVQNFRSESLTGGRLNVPSGSEDLWYLDAGDLDGQTNSNNASESSLFSYLGRANYTLLDRYLLTASLRVDGSSRFGTNNRFAAFPSVALGWRVSEESFWKDNISFVSNFKLRGSYGQIGNDKIGDYASQATISTGFDYSTGTPANRRPGATAIDLANPNLVWETVEQYNVGFEIGFLQQRLTTEFDYYGRTSRDLLVNIPVPSNAGFDAQQTVNLGEVENKGIDLSINWEDSKGDFNYRAGATFSTVNNKVNQLGTAIPIINGPLNFGGYQASITRVGDAIGSFYGYEVIGVNQDADDLANFPQAPNAKIGDLRFRDQDNNNVIDDADRVIIGNPTPSMIFGLTLGFGYKGLDFSMDWAGQAGNDIYNGKKQVRPDLVNFESSFLNRWTGPGTSTTEPLVENSGASFNVSDRFVEDGSFFRLNNVTVGYTFNSELTERVFIKKLRIYASGTNLVTFTDYSGFNPEIISSNPIATGIDLGTYPVPSVYTMGVDITF